MLQTIGSSHVRLAERPWKVADTRLVLENGSVWRAKSFGASGSQVGEVVFNTSLTGYQEILTDPSYAGQFVLMTNPHIGNTGVNFGGYSDDEESAQCFLGGLVIRSLSISSAVFQIGDAQKLLMNTWQNGTSWEYVSVACVMKDVDTLAITRRLRQDGSLIGVLSTEESKTDEQLLDMSRTWDIVGKTLVTEEGALKIAGVDLISGVSCKAPYEWSDKTRSEWNFNSEGRGESFRVIAYDFGIKHNILRRLASYDCKITVVPSSWPASEALKLKPDGVIFSNGPGDPSAVPYGVEIVKEIIGKVPVFEICKGHQLPGQALGGKTFKMKFGHHGGNHPVRNLRNAGVEISAQARSLIKTHHHLYTTSHLYLYGFSFSYHLCKLFGVIMFQNHNYAVDPASLPDGVEVTHVNLNDGSCAGLAFPQMKLMSLQYHPEASPGPHDSDPGNLLTYALKYDTIWPTSVVSCTSHVRAFLI
ncbi:hypothetical protein RJ639_035914 [Escallonia herrerae]|uniref:carbamoyl-phosphate synthase (glutamine-hydrolyzing) n=1 Tax=Escallonia herrerae TaxID=1293975 RepID=A0AA88WQW2_9ASTE|nr:hypothetical protein RJ639_035914 [Escallonia herrerae]